MLGVGELGIQDDMKLGMQGHEIIVNESEDDLSVIPRSSDATFLSSDMLEFFSRYTKFCTSCHQTDCYQDQGP